MRRSYFEGVCQWEGTVALVNWVIEALGAPSHVGDHVLRLKASIGISIYPDDGEDPETLIDRADAAMYRAKRRGLGSFVLHGAVPSSEQSLEPRTLNRYGRQALTH